MRRRKGPPAEIVVYRALKTAAGGSGSGSGGGSAGGYRPGQNVIAKIAKPEIGGYSVIIVKDNLPGYLPSNARHYVGDDVLATFVCFDKNRVLLSERFTHGKGDLVKKNYGGTNWEEQLDGLSESES